MVNHTIVLYPSPGIGHLISMVELGKLILKYYPSSFSITILITIAPYNTGSTAPYIDHVSKTTPSITFHYLPTITNFSTNTTTSPHHETLVFHFLRLNNPHVQQALLTLSTSSTISAFIIDFFCYTSLDLAHQLTIPVFFFYTSNLATLSIFLYHPTVHKNTTESFKDIKTPLNFPGLPPIPPSEISRTLQDRNDKAYEEFLYCAQYLAKARGIIVNSFELLEPRALKAIREGLCVPDAPTPPIYCIGPLIASHNQSGGNNANATQVSCLEWLDLQPRTSVVYLCFGSMGLFSVAQLKEIATGVEKSGHRFLWVVRTPHDPSKRLTALPDPDLDALLPQGFVERTKDRGLVVKSWAPQVEVLNKESVGGFVSHVGWNSVLEAVCAGVPIVAWPLYAEQRLNRVTLVELKLALPMQEEEDGFVGAEEVEKRVRELMESEDGKVMRKRIAKVSVEAKAAIAEGGSSVKALDDLAELWKSGSGFI